MALSSALRISRSETQLDHSSRINQTLTEICQRQGDKNLLREF
jgi:hypothetical protein